LLECAECTSSLHVRVFIVSNFVGPLLLVVVMTDALALDKLKDYAGCQTPPPSIKKREAPWSLVLYAKPPPEAGKQEVVV